MGRMSAVGVLLASAGLGGCMLDTTGLGPVEGGTEPNSYQCACTCAAPSRTRSQVVVQGVDDAEEQLSTGAVSLTSSDLELVDDLADGPQLVGIRFQSLGLPRGATIVSAHLQLTADETSSGTTNVVFQAEAADSAAPFSTAPGNLTARPRTAASVAWAPAPWTAEGEAGALQRTPDLAPLLQELLARPGWTLESAAVLLVSGSGRRVARAYDFGAATAPQLVVVWQEPAVTASPRVCMPDALNPNRGNDDAPTVAELEADCSGRVQDTLAGLSGACGYPSACSCALVPASTRLAERCNTACTEVALAADCSNFDPRGGITTATNAPGDAPVCITESPLTAALYGQRSACQVAGSAQLSADDETKGTAAGGLVELKGRPCPGASCAVGVAYQLDLAPITFESLFSSATFEDLAGLGASVPGGEAVLSAGGAGVLGQDATRTTARGRRGSESAGYAGTNDDVVGLQVVWGSSGPTCSMSGAMLGAVDPELRRCESEGPTADAVCTSDADCTDVEACTDGDCNCLPVGNTDVTLSLAVSGPLVNQPPTARAGSDRVVECNQPAAAAFQLASLSSDPDRNLVQHRWTRGGRLGPEVGFTPVVDLVQPLGAPQTYVLRVLDARAQGDEDAVVAQVVDTTPPALACNAPATLAPPDFPVTLRASAADVCDPAATPAVTGYRCWRTNGAGKVVDTTHACHVQVDGDGVTLPHGVGVGNHIAWDVTVTDASGNTSTTTCTVAVVRP